MEYILAKKKSMLSLAISPVIRPGVGAKVGLQGGFAIPLIRFWTFAERLVCRCVSRNSLMTLALDPLGPFFWGIALYVQVNCADEQFRHGLMPSHFTFLRWQASQALLTTVLDLPMFFLGAVSPKAYLLTAVDMMAGTVVDAVALWEEDGNGPRYTASVYKWVILHPRDITLSYARR